MNRQFMFVSALEKVFAKTSPESMPKGSVISGLKGEVISFQLAYTIKDSGDGPPRENFKVSISSDLSRNITLRSVQLVPSLLPAYEQYDDNYITTDPGMFPDLLEPLSAKSEIKLIPAQWRSLWIDVALDEDTLAGSHSIEVFVKDIKGEKIWRDMLSVKVIDKLLPEQKLIHTEWFHADCLADYYKTEVFSPEHWRIIEEFIKTAGKHGINMILTPIFTPPLDTKVGGERTTVQLVDVYKDEGIYSFHFDQLRTWAKICRRNEIKYLEIAHFFTQWGALFTPKIMGWEDGVYKRIFGWDVSATSTEYKEFTQAFIPELLKVLKEEGFDETNTYFHISDEPKEKDLDSYGAAKAVVASHLEGYPIIDALSSFEFYQHGLVERPVPSNDHIHTFIDNKVEDLWVYYCCAQNTEVPNRFMAMPSARNRILGVLLYLYDIKGFLHWGYNFYNTQYSIKAIDPHLVTDAGEAFQSGDAFIVYPGEDGKPKESIRLMILSQALYDLRAFKLLEELTTREQVVELIKEGVKDPITFKNYPKTPQYLEALRIKVNNKISQSI